MCEADEVLPYGLSDLYIGQQLWWEVVFLVKDTLAFRKIRGSHNLPYMKDQVPRLGDSLSVTVPTARILTEISGVFDSGFFVDGVVDFNLEATFTLLVLHDITYTFFLDLQDFEKARKEAKFSFRVVNPEKKTCVYGKVQVRFP